ncbi:hypothetical protein EPUL_003176, partial [Erysiphe pulchra]
MKTLADFSIIVRWFLFITQASSIVYGAIGNEEWKVNGYDCGKSFFTDQMVQDALQMALEKKGARAYVGLLYDVNLGYLTWPIVQNEENLEVKNMPNWRLWREAMYQVIFNTDGEVVDVIVKIRNYDFIRCWRVDQSKPEVQRVDMNNINGFYCGQRLIKKDDLENSLQIAHSKLNKGLYYPLVYTGPLYDEKLGFKIWPIYRGQEFYRSGSENGGPYFIVMDPEGQLRDVIARTASHKAYYVKCMISNKNNNSPSSSTVEQNSVISGTPQTGFDCNGIFFDENDLKVARDLAKNSYETSYHNVYPLLYRGPSFDTPCFLWPLQAYGKRLMPGRVQPYRLILSLRFEIMCVAVKSGDVIKKCEKKTFSADHFLDDKRNYLCSDTFFAHKELVLAAKAACVRLGTYKSRFPQKYEGFNFDIPGPYFIFPLSKGNKIRGIITDPGKHRV